MPWVLWLTLAGAQAASDEDARAIEEFRAAYKGADEEARARAVDGLAGRGGAKAIPVLADVLAGDTETVRIAVARALGAYDTASAVEAVGRAVDANAKSTKVMEALVWALEELDRESGAATLNELLRKHDRPEMFDVMPGLLRAIGKIGSSSSVAPLLDLLRHAEKESRETRVNDRVVPGSARHIELQRPIHKALREVTGGSETLAKQWDAWWNERGKGLVAGRSHVYRCAETGKRWEQKAAEPRCPHHDKARPHGELVKTRLGE